MHDNKYYYMETWIATKCVIDDSVRYFNWVELFKIIRNSIGIAETKKLNDITISFQSDQWIL